MQHPGNAQDKAGPALGRCERCGRTGRQGEGGGRFIQGSLTPSPFQLDGCLPHLCLVLLARKRGGQLGGALPAGGDGELAPAACSPLPPAAGGPWRGPCHGGCGEGSGGANLVGKKEKPGHGAEQQESKGAKSWREGRKVKRRRKRKVGPKGGGGRKGEKGCLGRGGGVNKCHTQH